MIFKGEKMNYEQYIKQIYVKKIMKKEKIDISEKWEEGMIAEQFLFILTTKLSANALKMLNAIGEGFVQDFSNGKPIEYNDQNIKNIDYFLRAQNFLNKLIKSIKENDKKLDDMIIPSQKKIDPLIWKYYLGNKIVFKGAIDLAEEQYNAINNSLTSSFKNNQKEIQLQKNNLIETFNKTNIDINILIDNINKYLFSSEIFKTLK